MTDSQDLIKKLNLMSHPEGGHFSESFRDENNNVSLIYYLLQRYEWSHWHRLKKNETLHFYKGDPLKIYISKDGIDYKSVTLPSFKGTFKSSLSKTFLSFRSLRSLILFII